MTRRPSPPARPSLALVLVCILISPPSSWGQSPSPGPAKPAEPPKQAAPSPSDKKEPPKPDPAEDDLNLDDLLGTKPKTPPPPAGGAGSAAAADLDRKLSAKEMGDAFHEAVVLMGDAAGRIRKSKDTGVTTQRVQESIVRKLDLLIDQMEQQSQSGQPQPNQSQPQDSQQQSSQRRQQQRQPSQTPTGENNSEMDPPARRDGALGPEIDAARAAWGSLPERVRQMLMQGSSDKFSEAYKKLTEEYYRKLAEEGKK